MITISSIRFISELLYNSYRLPISLFTDHYELIFEKDSRSFNPVYKSKQHFFSKLIKDLDDSVSIYMTSQQECYVTIKVDLEQNNKGFFIIGPALTSDLSFESVQAMANDYHLDKTKTAKLFGYFKELRVTNQLTLKQIGQLAFYLIFQKEICTNDITLNYNSKKAKASVVVDHDIKERRLNATFHMDLRQEQLIWQFVKSGDERGLADYLNTFKVEGIGTLVNFHIISSKKAI